MRSAVPDYRTNIWSFQQQEPAAAPCSGIISATYAASRRKAAKANLRTLNGLLRMKTIYWVGGCDWLYPTVQQVDQSFRFYQVEVTHPHVVACLSTALSTAVTISSGMLKNGLWLDL